MRTRLLAFSLLFVFQLSVAKSVTECLGHKEVYLVTDPVIPTIAGLSSCSIGGNGVGVFNLVSQNPLITAAQTGSPGDYAIVYYETYSDAFNFGTPISNTVEYVNIVSFHQTVYYRIIDLNTNAFAVGSFDLDVIPPLATGVPNVLSACDDDEDGFGLFNLETNTPQILNGMNPLTVNVTYYTTLAQAQAGVNPIIPSTYYLGSTLDTVYARATSTITGCFNVTSFYLRLEPVPYAQQPNYPPYILCDDTGQPGYEIFDLTSKIDSILFGQTGMNVSFYPSLTDAQNDTNPITNPAAYVNTVASQVIGIRITNLATGCNAVSSMEIRVAPVPQLTPPSDPYVICDNDFDGYGLFDFTPMLPELLQGANYTITYHETLADAEAGVSDLGTPIQNSVPFTQIIYLRAQDPSSACYSVLPVTLNVHDAPHINEPSFNEACDNDGNNEESFDLTVKIPEILGSLDPSLYTVTFYHTLDEAEQGVNPIVPATNYIGGYGELLSVRVEDNASHCTSFVYTHLILTTPLELSTPTPLSVCDADANPNDQYTAFDLTVKSSEITQGAGGYTVTYYPSLFNAQSGTNPIANPTSYINTTPAIQTVGVRVTSASGCVSITTLDIRVLPIPNYANSNPPALGPKCDETNGQMLANFDLTVNAAYIVNGDPNLTLHFFHSMVDAENFQNEIATPTNALVGGNVWIRVENTRVDFQGNHCYVLVEQPLTINPVPNSIITTDNTLNTVYVDGTNGVVIQPLLLNSSLTGNYAYEWYEISNPSITIGTGPTYLVDTASPNNASRNYSVHITNLSTGCEGTTALFLVLQSNGVPPPSGIISQSFPPGSTLADIEVSGTNVQWYASASNKTMTVVNSAPLPLNTVLVNDATYYASQTVGGIESIERLPVTVHLVLGVADNEILPLLYAPNPVTNRLNLHSTKVLKSIRIYTMLGQKVFEQHFDATDLTIDLSNLATGNYILKAQGDTGQKTIRIIKE